MSNTNKTLETASCGAAAVKGNGLDVLVGVLDGGPAGVQLVAADTEPLEKT